MHVATVAEQALFFVVAEMALLATVAELALVAAVAKLALFTVRYTSCTAPGCCSA